LGKSLLAARPGSKKTDGIDEARYSAPVSFKKSRRDNVFVILGL
jgi:hypothetical protein